MPTYRAKQEDVIIGDGGVDPCPLGGSADTGHVFQGNRRYLRYVNRLLETHKSLDVTSCLTEWYVGQVIVSPEGIKGAIAEEEGLWT